MRSKVNRVHVKQDLKHDQNFKTVVSHPTKCASQKSQTKMRPSHLTYHLVYRLVFLSINTSAAEAPYAITALINSKSPVAVTDSPPQKRLAFSSQLKRPTVNAIAPPRISKKQQTNVKIASIPMIDVVKPTHQRNARTSTGWLPRRIFVGFRSVLI